MLKLISRAYARIDPTPADFCDNVDYDELTIQHLVCIFRRFYNAAILSVVAVSIIWIIISGIRYMSAGSDEEALANAKRSLTFAVLGFVLIIAAYTIITVVGIWLGSDLDLPNFTLPAAR